MRRVRVGDVLQLQRRAVSIDPATEYRLIGVYSFGKGIFHREPKIGAELGNYKFFAVEPGDLVLSNIQAWEGAIGFATEADRGTIGTHRFLAYTAIDPDEIDTNWARYFFLSEAGFPLIQKAAPGSVTRNRTLAVERFEALEIPLPDIDDQRRIAAHLDRAAAGVDRLRAGLDRAAGLVSALPLSGVARSLTSGAIRTERIGDILQLFRRPVEVELEVPYLEIGVRSFGRGLFLKEPIAGAELGRKRVFWVEPGDLVISNVFAWEGAVGIATAEHAGTIGSHRFMTFRAAADDVNVGFLRWFFATAEGVALLAAASPGSAGRNRTLAIERFLDLEVPLPDRESQATVVDLANRLTPAIGIGDQRRQLADAVVPSALNRAFAGLA